MFLTIYQNLSEDDIISAFTTSLYKTEIVSDCITKEVHGITTDNLYIFLREIPKKYTDIKNGAPYIITFIHEFSHYLRRCKAVTLRESKGCKTPTHGENIESCFYAESKIFGGMVRFISKSGLFYI